MGKVRFATDLAWNEIEECVVVLKTSDNQTFHQLNETGSVIWRSLQDEKTLEEVAKDITQSFEVDVETARTDVREFLSSLEQKNLIQTPSS